MNETTVNDPRGRDFSTPLGSATSGSLSFARGGASEVAVTLPRPSGTVPVRISGGASDVTINRPTGVAARVRVDGGASELALDEQRFGAIGGETRLQTSDYEGATDRYDVEVSGGASKLTVDTP